MRVGKGSRGLPGKVGPRGDVGPAGPQGIQGLQGIQGTPGRDGVDGKDGTDGKDGRGHGPVLPASGAGVVGMGVGDQGPGNRPPRVDPSFGGLAIQTLRCAFDQASLMIVSDILKAPKLERVCSASNEAARCRSVCFSPCYVPSSDLTQNKLPTHKSIPNAHTGYIIALGQPGNHSHNVK